MTTQQPEALRLADITEFDRYPQHPDHKQHVAKELRRLHESNQGLLKAMVQAAQAIIDKAERTTT